MINKINTNLNFTSNVVLNNTLYKGFERAKIEARTGNENQANQFANAINYLINDDSNDTYTVTTGHSAYESKTLCHLRKNGRIIASNDNSEKLSLNVMNLIRNYVKNDLRQNINKPLPIANNDIITNNIAKAKKSIDIISKQLEHIDIMKQSIEDVKSSINAMEHQYNHKILEPKQAYPSSEAIVHKLNDIINDKHIEDII